MLTPEDYGWSSEGLVAVEEMARSTGTAQLVVTHPDGAVLDIVFSPEPVDVYAVQKGVMALLLGIAQEKYLLEITDNANHHLTPEWTGLSPWDEAKLTIEILMNMITGMDDELKPLGEIGKSWRYNNTAYQYLKKILCDHTDMSLQALSDSWLFDPIGLNQTTWVNRPQLLANGIPISGMLSTAQDLSRIGLLVLGKGDIQGDTIMSEKFYFDELAAPGSEENPAWGLMWWNNHSSHHRNPMREQKIVDGPAIPQAPADLIAARGAVQNHLAVVPSLELVVARTTQTPAAGERPAHFEQEFWRLLMAARLS